MTLRILRALQIACSLSLIVWSPRPATALETAGDGARSPTDCAALSDMARTGRSSDERSFALRALAQCPRSEAVRSTLENAVRNDDAPCRQSAFESLGSHLTHATLPLILEMYRKGKCDADQTLCYRYASTLAGPEDRADLLSMSKEGIVSHNRSIKTSALITAGKIRVESEKPRIRESFKDPDPSVAAAALTGAGFFPPDAYFLEDGIGAMRSADFAVQSKAILLVAHVGGDRAKAALVHLEFSGLHETNRALLVDILAKLGQPKRSAITVRPARMHREPSDNAPLVGVLEANEVVYIEDNGRTLHSTGATVSAWAKIRSFDGAQGWVKGVDIRAHDAIASRETPEQGVEKKPSKKIEKPAGQERDENKDIRDMPHDVPKKIAPEKPKGEQKTEPKTKNEKKQGNTNRKLTPLAGTDWDDVARFYAGLPVPGTGPLASIASLPESKRHSEAMDKMFTAFEASHLSKMRSWAAAEIGDPGTPVLFYPFGGPDMIISQTFFPHVKDFVLFGLENPGRPPNPLLVDQARVGRVLDNVQKSLHSMVHYTYFQTKLMEQDLYATEIKGIVPLLLVFLARTGNKITDVCEVWIDDKGNLSEIADDTYPKTNREVPGRVSRKKLKVPGIPGIRIHFERDGQARTTTFFQANVDDTHLAQIPYFLKYIRSLGSRSVYIKAASYLLHWGNFNLLRAFIHNESKLILQDDTGIPLRMFDMKAYELTFFGNYIKPIPLFHAQFQADLRRIYTEKKGVRALPFTIGYTFRPGESSLILAKRKP